jgi:hypothetical protein
VIRRLQLDGSVPGVPRLYRGAWHCVKTIVAQEGVRRALYTGLLPQLLKSVPVASTSLATYDVMKQFLKLEIAR